MITQYQFNKALQEVNQAFDKTFKRLAALEQVNKRIDKLEEKVNSYVDSHKEKASGSKKTRPKAS